VKTKQTAERPATRYRRSYIEAANAEKLTREETAMRRKLDIPAEMMSSIFAQETRLSSSVTCIVLLLFFSFLIPAVDVVVDVVVVVVDDDVVGVDVVAVSVSAVVDKS
jgi:hypothetical protein